MVHVVSAMPTHGSWNYSPRFFKRLAERNGYVVVAEPRERPEVKENHISVVMLKGKAQPFEERVGFEGPLRVADFSLYRTKLEVR